MAMQKVLEKGIPKDKTYPQVLVIRDSLAGAGDVFYDRAYFERNHKEYKLPFNAIRVFSELENIDNWFRVNENEKLTFPIANIYGSNRKFEKLNIWELRVHLAGAGHISIVLEKG